MEGRLHKLGGSIVDRAKGERRTSFSKLSSKLSLFLRWLRMNSAMGLLLLPSWLRLKVPSLFSFLHKGSPGHSPTQSSGGNKPWSLPYPKFRQQQKQLQAKAMLTRNKYELTECRNMPCSEQEDD